ncbi:uncharacterized protein LOC119669365 isoform X2 [Teleopsis dalmanni]|nr:uncharacterized protein LOC119669365 isoform X2 [Teleopsis dalmanni]
MRIQEEIKEVVRREEEHRQLTSTMGAPVSLDEYDEIDGHDSHNNNDTESSNSISLTPEPLVRATAVVTSLAVQDDVPSLASSINSKESFDGHHSDDSGISASSSPNTNKSSNNNNNEVFKSVNKEQRYIGPNCYNMTPEPPQQKLMTRTVSTPHLAVTKPRQFAVNPAHKGVMQRFIASRGKIQLNNNAAANKIFLNGKSAAALMNSPITATPPNTPMSAAINMPAVVPDFSARNPASIVIPTVSMTPTVIERDAEGRPIRPGYVSAEVKIQRELKDLKKRETELKKIRKIRLSTPDLLDSIDNDNVETDEEDEFEVEHCYGPNKLRSAKSISELCELSHFNGNLSPSTTPSPDFDTKLHFSRGSGMRPAMSLAQLCDLTPEEAPSSHRLIAQWENLIQQNA